MDTAQMRTNLWHLAAFLAVFGVSALPLSAQPHQKAVTLKAPDGITLKATHYSPGKPGPGVVLLHQCNRDRTAWQAFARDAAARGYHVIAMDYRGYGESEGERFQDFQQQGPVVAAAGASCGVNQSVLLASRHPEVRTVILLSGNTTAAGREYLRKFPGVAVLGVASEDDGPALPILKWILGWSSNPANRLVEYKAAGHGTDMFAVEKGLQPLMLDWLDSQLRRAPTTQTNPASLKTTPIQAFWDALRAAGGVSRARVLFDEARKRGTAAELFPEGELNAFGYEVLQEGRAADAVVVFEMNVESHPRSANAYDSLSDALLAAGRPAEALRFADKAIDVLATDTTTPDDFKQRIRERADGKIRQLKKDEVHGASTRYFT